MMKAVLDSSVLVSAFLKPAGVNGQILRAAQRGYELCLSLELLAETAATLGRPKFMALYARPNEAVRDFCTGLAEVSTFVEALPNLAGAVPRDPKDDMVVATALRAGANFLVSGDRHLLSLGAYQGIKIVTPREFLDLVSAERP